MRLILSATAASLKARTRELLKTWDHKYLNDLPDFQTLKAVTLEILVRSMGEQLLKQEPRLRSLEVVQGAWSAQWFSSKDPEMLLLKRKQRFQSLLASPQGYQPLDYWMTITWGGKINASGLLLPWVALKQQLQDAQNTLARKFSSEKWSSKDAFLKACVQSLKDVQRPEARVHQVDFFDPLDQEGVRFRSPEDFVEK